MATRHRAQNTGQAMATRHQAQDIAQAIDRLLVCTIPLPTFRAELCTILNQSRAGLLWKIYHPHGAEPYTDCVREAVANRLDQIRVQREHINREIETATATGNALDGLLASGVEITPESIVETLGKDVYASYIDQKIYGAIVALLKKSKAEKAVLQHRIWVVDRVVEREYLDASEIGDLLIDLLVREGQWVCSYTTLFEEEYLNRVRVLRWLGADNLERYE